VRLSPLDIPPLFVLFGLLYPPRMIDDKECGGIGGIMGRGNQRTRRKPAVLPFYSPQVPHDLPRDRTRGYSGGKPATNRVRYGTA
jgi:hypothetical protein